jgi:hypothetical protein
MPLYDFRNTKTGEVFEEFFKISEKEEYLLANPHIQQLVSKITLGDSMRLGIRRPDQGFKDVLRKIKSAHPKGHINV